ncbi:MAG: GTP-binding protein [Acidimicrobiales bacterium]
MIFGRSNTVDLPERLGSFEEAVDLADGRLSGVSVATGRHVIDKAQARIRHGTTHTLIALLGATGGGKSSLTNAIVGSDVATTGIRRPTTSSTLASYWGDEDPQPLLDWLEIANRHHVATGFGSGASAGAGPLVSLDGLILLDVPDHDSVEFANRQEMERIAEHADLLVWVTDSEKYGDKAMHGYLRQLSEHGAVTAMVLNKIDQLAGADVEACRTDLAKLLADDGLTGTPILALSTVTGEGVDELTGLLAATVADRRAMVERLEADVRSVANELLVELGPDEGTDAVPRTVTSTLSTELVGASGLDAVCDAVAAGHRRDAVRRTGWPFTRWLRSLRPHPLRRLHLGEGSGGRASLPEPSGVQKMRSEAAVVGAVREVTASMPEPWPDLIRSAAMPDLATLNDRIDGAISQSVRDGHRSAPKWWQLVNVGQLALAIAAIVGAVWLALLAFGAYLRLPDVPTPEYRGIPIPTGLLIGGVLLGLLLALLAKSLASVGAKRRARAVRRQAETAVTEVAADLIISPMQAELERRDRLRELLETASA